MKKVRLIALYLPQFHPIPENDEWWGKGFTEWTNTAKAKPLFRGHYQPHVPADLGFYDLRLSESRVAQAKLAEEYGIEAFCYYHYWFAGRRILERPFNEVLSSGKPKFSFCLCWANETWSGIWHGLRDKILIEQTYPGKEDYINHFNSLLIAFKDERYLKINGKPIFVIYKPFNIPDLERLMDLWNDMATKSGLKGIHFVSMQRPSNEAEYKIFEAFTVPNLPTVRSVEWISKKRLLARMQRSFLRKVGTPTIYSYAEIALGILDNGLPTAKNYPCLVPNWDNTPRSGSNGLVLDGSTPDLFRNQLKKAIEMSINKPLENRIIFIKSWNEWAEGNYLEPDLKYGLSYLKVIQQEI